MDHRRRPRREISTRTETVLPFVGFRFSAGRDAYVLRGVGKRFGPVLQARRHEQHEQPTALT